MNERFPTSLNQETLEASNLYYGLCKSSSNLSHILIGRPAIQFICVNDIYLGVPFHSIA